MDQPLEAKLNMSAPTKKNWLISEMIDREEAETEMESNLTYMRSVLPCWIVKPGPYNPG